MELNDLITLQFWVVAMGKEGPVILAESDPFTLISWMKFSPGFVRGKIRDQATPRYETLAAIGEIKNLPENYDKPANWERFKEKNEQPLGVHRSSKRQPVLNGPTANDELQKWVETSNLKEPR